MVVETPEITFMPMTRNIPITMPSPDVSYQTIDPSDAFLITSENDFLSEPDLISPTQSNSSDKATYDPIIAQSTPTTNPQPT